MPEKHSHKSSTSSSGSCEANFRFLPIECLRTTYSAFRSGYLLGSGEDLNYLPLRVVLAEDGKFEIIDGFKRFESWQTAGWNQVPVIIEHPGSRPEHKKLILLANAPKRTITPLDEASIVHSLLEEDKLTEAAIAKLLERKKEWVARRLALETHLSINAKQKMGQGELGITIADHLTALPDNDQDKILAAIERHSLRNSECLALIQCYRMAHKDERRILLENPLGTVRPEKSPVFSPRFQEIEHRLEQISQGLSDLRSLSFPKDLAPAEERRLRALFGLIGQELTQTIREIGQQENCIPQMAKTTAMESVPDPQAKSMETVSQNAMKKTIFNEHQPLFPSEESNVEFFQSDSHADFADSTPRKKQILTDKSKNLFPKQPP